MVDIATPHGSIEPPATRTGTLPIVEIFHSIQGEGLRSGEPATFIRLAGCNLRCVWCDTEYSWSSEGVARATPMKIEAIVNSVRERTVVITGGEPMLHRRRLPLLIEQLREHDVSHITIETNSTIFDSELTKVIDLWSLSPKLPSSGEQVKNDIISQYLQQAHGRVQLKFVVTNKEDYDNMWTVLTGLRMPLPIPIIVQPDGFRIDYAAALDELTRLVLDDDTLRNGVPRRSLLRVMPQLHRVIWGVGVTGV